MLYEVITLFFALLRACVEAGEVDEAGIRRKQRGYAANSQPEQHLIADDQARRCGGACAETAFGGRCQEREGAGPGQRQTRLRIFMSQEGGLPDAPSQIIKLSSLGTEPELVELNGDSYNFV